VTVALVAIIAVLGGCGASQSASPYRPLTEGMIRAVNYQYDVEAPPIRFSIASRSVPLNEEVQAKAAAKAVVRDCNEGAGTRIVAVGLVNSTIAKHPVFAVFMNPPGHHIWHSAESPPPDAPPLNWYAAFVTSVGRPFCTFGHSPNLPALRVHGG
jgi:hypothetical protein